MTFKLSKYTEEELAEFKDIEEIDVEVDGKVRLCCCQPYCPHDESVKFLLIGKE